MLRLRNSDDLCAWKEFVELYQPLIRGLCLRRGLQQSDADDVTQEVFTQVARSIGEWDPDPAKGSFRGWLSTITRNRTIQSFRENQRRPSVGFSESEPLVDAPSNEFDKEHEQQLFRWAAQKIQSRFQESTWQAFWHTAVEGRNVQGVAEELGISRAQVYVARSRVMSLLRKTIEQSQFDSQTDVRRP